MSEKPKLTALDEPFHEETEKAKQESISRDTRDLLMHFVKATPGARDRLMTYVANLVGNDPDRLEIPKDRTQQYTEMLTTNLSSVVQNEAQRLMQSTVGGKVKKEEVLASANTISAEYEKLRERARNSPRYRRERAA